jgi:nucleoside-diphosphate-sugar epimerase
MLVHQNAVPVKPARIIILGAGGFLSPVVAHQCADANIPVHAISSRQIDLTADGSPDKLAAEMQKDDAVVMTAALTPDKGRDIATLMRNLRMAESVCVAISRTAPAHFLYISSDAVYDARFSSLLNEESTCDPVDLYSLMHTAREKMLGETCRRTGVPLTIIRPCAIYGPGDTHNSYGPNRFVRTAAKDGKITLFGGGEEMRHHVYVADVAALIQLCILHRSAGVINAITGEAVSFAHLARSVAAGVGKPVTIEQLPRMTPITHRHFDTSGLIRAFPFFRPTPLEIGLAHTIDGMVSI